MAGGITTGLYPAQYTGVFATQNGTTSTVENLVQAPIKMNTEAFSGTNVIGASIHSGSGTPQGNLAAGSGAFYFRWDTPTIANQRLYVCTVGGATVGACTWVGIA